MPSMDRILARTIDHISLSGPQGTSLLSALEAAYSRAPTPAALAFFAADLRRFSPTLLTSPDWTRPAHLLNLVAEPGLRRRALGYAAFEHPPLPQPAWRVLQHVGRAGPAGILQSELASLVALSPVMVSHYIAALSARRLLARKKVVLTTRPPAPSSLVTRRTPGRASVLRPAPPHAPSRPAPDAPDPAVLPAINVTYTSVLVLARFAAVIAASNAAKSVVGEERPPAPLVDVSAYPTHPANAARDDERMAILDLNVERSVERIMAALRVPPHIRTQRDLKAIAMPEDERPPKFTPEVYQRRRHRAFRAFRTRLEKLGVVSAVERRCVDATGKPRGVLTCLKLKGADVAEAEQEVGSVIVKEECAEGVPADDAEAVAVVGDLDDAWALAAFDARIGGSEELTRARAERPGFLVEVGLIQQIFQLLQKSGARGMSVPELFTHLDRGTNLTSAPTKRIRKIINGISSHVPIIETQKFEGSAMHLRICLAEFVAEKEAPPSNADSADVQEALPPSDSDPRPSQRARKSERGRRKNELTSLGLRRQQMVMDILEERKAVIIETLGREVAQREDAGLQRVDQKVMRRITQDLLLQKRIESICTTKPCVNENKDMQTIRLVVLPGVKESDPAVAEALSPVVARNIYGHNLKSPASKKRKADEGTPCAEDEDDVVEESASARRPSKGNTEKRRRTSKAQPRENAEGEGGQENVAKDKSLPSATATSSEPTKAAVVVESEPRDSRAVRLARLRATDHGVMKGKMARVRKLHEHLYQIASSSDYCKGLNRPVYEHVEPEYAMNVKPLTTFTIGSCLNEMTVAEYARVIGLHRDHGATIRSIKDEKVGDVLDIMESELLSTKTDRQVRSLIQVLVRLDLVMSEPGGKWCLRGAGVIRDFGKGMPVGVLAHGVVFTDAGSVDRYWEELQQFAFRARTHGLGEVPESWENGEIQDGSLTNLVNDVYVRVRWNKGTSYMLRKQEILAYEAMLQDLLRTDVGVDDEGVPMTSNFNVGTLRQFTVTEIFDYMANLVANRGVKKFADKYLPSTERLLLYARYRAQHAMPQIIRQSSQPPEVRDATVTLAGGDDRGDTESVLRCTRGLASVNASTLSKAASRLSQASLRRNLVVCKTGRRRSVPLNEVEAEVDIEKCLKVMRGIICDRAVAYCVDVSEVPQMNIADLFSNMMKSEDTANLADEMRRTECEEEIVHFRQAVVALCETSLVHSAIDILSLRLAIRLRTRERCSSTNTLNEQARKMQLKSDNPDVIMRAVMIESSRDLRRHYRLSLRMSASLELKSKECRQALIEQEFGLLSNMRMRLDRTMNQNLAVLVRRHRTVLEVEAGMGLRHGLFFQDDVDDGRTAHNEHEGEDFSETLMEQALMSVLMEGWPSQASNDAERFISRFRESAVARARRELLLRGVMRVRKTETMEIYFAMTKAVEAANGDEAIASREDTIADQKQESMWEQDMLAICQDHEDKKTLPFFNTALGKDAGSGKSMASLKASLLTCELTFFGADRGMKLDLIPRLYGGVAADGAEGSDEEEEGAENGSKIIGDMRMDVEFAYREDITANIPTAIIAASETQPETNAAQAKLLSTIHDALHKAGRDGLTLCQLTNLHAAIPDATTTTILPTALYQTLRAGIAHRIPIETAPPQIPPSAPVDPCLLCGTLYLHDAHAHAFYTDPRSTHPRLASIWTSFRGTPNDALAHGVSQTLLRAVRRRPGMRESDAVRAAQARHAGLPSRAAADMLFVLERKGALRRVVLAREQRPFCAFEEAGQPRVEEVSAGAVATGAAFVDERQGGEAVLQTVPGVRVMVGGAEMSEIGRRLW